ncbi:Signal transduction histidine kinase [Pedobacter steynii]|uniref:histidine kinase n=1 Tax=Pedobacter steynii TaxID=430522 RepID=A0A1G9N7J8_9SPHI|nr:tetratricopeptide repeat-containing sensor histidine kinase [Pedobacter steynii]NQX39388.1 tetratricopeptide repeat-containing sensor histidine kinase [Pedobacter steynii]SDL82353.1 Signal transduction histidine kinase [Pedobacter steynii]
MSFRVTLFFLGLVYALSMASCKQIAQEPANHPAHFDTVVNQAGIYLGDGQNKRAVRHLDSAYRSFPHPGIKDLYRKYDNLFNIYLNYDFNIPKARLYTDSVFQLLKGKETTYKNEYTNALFFLGEVLMAEKRYTEAFKTFYDARSFADKNLEDCALSIFSFKLGLVRYTQEEYGKAIPFFKEAMVENKDCKPGAGFDYLFVNPQNYLNTIALCFEKSGALDSAVVYYHKALDFIAANKARFPKRQAFITSASGVIYGNLGGIYVKKGEDEQAKKYLKESIAINDRPGYDIQDAQTAKLKLAALYIGLSDYAGGERLLNELEDFLSCKYGLGQRNNNIRIKWVRLKYEYYRKNGKPLLAYPYLQKSDASRDSVIKADRELKNFDVDKAFKDTEQKYRLALLNKDNQLKTAYLAAAVICIVMVMIILFFIWYNLRHSRRVNRQISEQNINMQKTLSSLERSQEENVKMMMIVAHDLRNPIGNITAMADLMLADQDRAEDDMQMLEMIKKSGQNSLHLVNDLLKVNNKTENLQKEPVDLYVLLNYCVNLLRHKAEEKKQQLILHAVHVTISVNTEKMWRVMSNLIGNAVKFSPESAAINISIKEGKDRVLIAVEDHGIGIPAAIKTKIFDMSGEGQRSGTAGEQPYGLGLAISRQIIESHGGRIWVESEPEKGSIFYIELPL